MKDYKVGDTITIKAQVVQTDEGDTQPYKVTFLTNADDYEFTSFWVRDSEVVEPVKPVLTKDVADELKDAKKAFHDFYAYLDSADRIWQPKTYTYVFSSDTNRDAKIKILSDAWYNGYTIEQVPRYMVYVPGTNNKFLYNKRGDSSTRAAKLETPIVPSPVTSYQTAYSQYKPLYWFTDEEINRFNLQDCEKELVADD